jgi:MtN3 and saliva related transmembrane protein
MDHTTIIGSVAGLLGVVSFVPQIVKIWRTKSSKDVSLAMFLVFCVSTLLWIAYGILVRSAPIIATNVSIFILASTVLVLKAIYR